MNLPHSYSYNPRLLGIFWLFGVGLMLVIAVWLTSAPNFLDKFTQLFGLALIILGLVLTVRWIAFDCYLVLDKDALVLPTGFGRVRIIRIPYTSIERAWEETLTFGTVVLCLATKEGKFEIVAKMLPDTGSYTDVRKFLYAQVDQRNR